MKENTNIVVIFLCLIIFAFSMVPQSSQNQETGLSCQVIRLIQTANEVSVAKVGPVWDEGKKFQILSKEYLLNEEKKEELSRLLQDPESYLFDKTKMCLFVPELMIHMGEGLQILVNKTGKQLEFYCDGVRQRVECDPSYSKIMKLFEEIEWEDLNEAN